MANVLAIVPKKTIPRPIRPKDWTFEKADKDFDQYIKSWRRLTEDVITNAYLIYLELAKEGRPKKTVTDVTVPTWNEWCESKGTSRMTFHRHFIRLGWLKKEEIETPELPKKKFAVVYADPPWKYDFSPTDSRAIENQYPTMSLDELTEYAGVPEDKNCLLVMWATAPKLRDALQVLEAWNFRYVTHGVWDKERLGMGYWFRSVHEDLLIGVRGQVSPPEEKLRIPSMFREKRDEEHSRKPDMIYDYIESWFPNQKYVELFGRPKVLRPGWTYVTDKGIVNG